MTFTPIIKVIITFLEIFAGSGLLRSLLRSESGLGSWLRQSCSYSSIFSALTSNAGATLIFNLSDDPL